MESQVRVWSRAHNRAGAQRIFLDKGVIDAVTEQDGSPPTYKRNTLCLRKSKSDGSITMSIVETSFEHGTGSYDLYVHLTEDEIAKLFLECFPQIRVVIARVVPPPPAGSTPPE